MEKGIDFKTMPHFIMKSMESSLNNIYQHFLQEQIINEDLREENARLKSDSYKDEELSKMKAELDEMKADYYRGFPISKEEQEKIDEWKKKQIQDSPSPRTAIGGRFTYEFYPTSIGVAASVIDGMTKEKFVFRELN